MQLPTFTRLRMACEIPVLERELRERMRGTRSYGIIGAYTVAVCVWVLCLYTGLAHLFRDLSPREAAPLLGEGIWTWGCVLQACLLPLAMPALTAGAITLEREREMLELLLLTHQSPVRICLGKLFSGVGLGLTLLASSVPPLCLCLFLGGVTPEEMLKSLCMLASAVVMGGAFGLAASSVCRSTQSAAAVSCTLLGSLLLVLPPVLIWPDRNPNVSPRIDAEILTLVTASFVATFAPGIGLATLAVHLVRRRLGSRFPLSLPRHRRLLGAVIWCGVLLAISHPSMTEVSRLGRPLLLLHPAVAVVSQTNDLPPTSDPRGATGAITPYNPSNPLVAVLLGRPPKETALSKLILGIGALPIRNAPGTAGDGIDRLLVGAAVIDDELRSSPQLIPNLWWMCSLLYLSLATWCFLIAVVRLGRMRTG